MTIEILRAQEADASRLAKVFNLSFYRDYLEYGACPGYHKTANSILSSLRQHDVYKIIADHKIVGAISVKKEKEGHYFLGALCVIPDYANQGIGQQAMDYLEKAYPEAKHWSLETPSKKAANQYFYKKLGFRETKNYMVGNVCISFFERIKTQ